MAFEPFMQILRGLQGKRNNVGIGDIQNAQQMAYLRNLEKEMNQQYVLDVPLMDLKVVVFDIETTGFSPEKGDTIISLGAIKMRGDQIIEDEVFYSLIHTDQKIPDVIVQLTGITNEQVSNADTL